MFIHMYIQNHANITNHLDIDECSDGTRDCSETCINTVGSFTCVCNYGYVLDTGGFTCYGKHKHVYHYDY